MCARDETTRTIEVLNLNIGTMEVTYGHDSLSDSFHRRPIPAIGV